MTRGGFPSDGLRGTQDRRHGAMAKPETKPSGSTGPETEEKRQLRYLAPNSMTAVSVTFGLVSIGATHAGHFSLAAWMIIYAVLCDRLDGLIARLMRATSTFGMQLDSFADFLNFGVAPAFLLWTFLTGRPDLPYSGDGWEHWALAAACCVWVLGAVFRLARYNVTSDEEVPTKIFFGVPTTMAGGLVAIWFLAFLKYEPGADFGGYKLLGESFTTPRGVWLYFPIFLVIGAYLMVSSLPMPKGSISRRKLLTAAVFTPMAVGYVCGFAQLIPEALCWMPTIWMTMFLIWGQVSETARGLKPPRIFPRADDVQPKLRLQEDLDIDTEEPPVGS
jgi:CDP-diacylglycerol---serine O-phosphatidyltransferase